MTGDAQRPPAACYQCSGLPGPATVADDWLRWALDYRPTYLRPGRPMPRDARTSVPGRCMSPTAREFAA